MVQEKQRQMLNKLCCKPKLIYNKSLYLFEFFFNQGTITVLTAPPE